VPETRGQILWLLASGLSPLERKERSGMLVQAALVGSRKGLIVKDSFDRADAAALGAADSGQAWSAADGTWGVIGARCYLSSATAHGSVVMELRTPDIDMEVDCRLSTAVNRADFGPLFRNIDNSNYLLGVLGKVVGVDHIALYKREAGAFTQLAEVASAGLVEGRTYKFRIVARGTRIELLVDGVSKISYTLTGGDATLFTTPTKIGFRTNVDAGADDGGSRYDNLSVRRAS